MARGIAQHIRKLFIRGHHPNGIGRDHKEIVRIVGLFGVQRGMHWCSPTQSNVTRIGAAGGFTLASTRSCSTLQPGLTKARRFDGEDGAAWRQPFGNSLGTSARASTRRLRNWRMPSSGWGALDEAVAAARKSLRKSQT